MNDLPENPRQFAKISKGNSSRLKSKMARAVLCAESGNQTWPAYKNRILWQNVRKKFFRTARQPFRLSHIHAFYVNSSRFSWARSHNFFKMENGKNYIFINFFFFQIYVNFISSPSKSGTNYWVAWIGLNFYAYHGLKPKKGHLKQYWTLV